MNDRLVSIQEFVKSTSGLEEGKALWEFMQQLRAELESAGTAFRTKEEIDAELEELRDWDGKLDELERQRNEIRILDENPTPG